MYRCEKKENKSNFGHNKIKKKEYSNTELIKKNAKAFATVTGMEAKDVKIILILWCILKFKKKNTMHVPP